MYKKIFSLVLSSFLLSSCSLFSPASAEVDYTFSSMILNGEDLTFSIYLKRTDLDLHQPMSTELKDSSFLNDSLAPVKMELYSDSDELLATCDTLAFPHVCALSGFIPSDSTLKPMSKLKLSVSFKDGANTKTDLILPYLVALPSPKILWPIDPTLDSSEIAQEIGTDDAEDVEPIPAETTPDSPSVEISDQDVDPEQEDFEDVEEIQQSPEGIMLAGLKEDNKNVLVFAKAGEANKYTVSVELCLVGENQPCLAPVDFQIFPAGDSWDFIEPPEFYACEMEYRSGIFKMIFDFEPQYYGKVIYTVSAMDDRASGFGGKSSRSSSNTIEVLL